MHNLIPYVWQMVFANVLIQGWIVDSYVQSLFYCSQEVLILSSQYTKVVNSDTMTRDDRMVMDRGRDLKMFLEPLCKISCWLTNILFITSPLLHLYLYMTPLFFMMVSLSLGAIRRFLMVSPPFRCTCTPYLLHVLLKFSLKHWWYGTSMCGWLMLGCSSV